MRISRREFINRGTAGIAGAGLLGMMSSRCRAEESSSTEKPNIIFILSDDYGIPGVGCYGGEFETPNLDALAAGGMRFEYCFSAPLCAPSRALCVTGRYAFRTGVSNNGQGANATPDKDGCVAQLMKQAGYATAVAGKWRQLTYFTSKEDGQKWGFDEFMVWGVGSADEKEEGEEKEKKEPAGRKDKKQKEAEKGSRYWDPDFNHNGRFMDDTQGKYGPDLLHEFVVEFIRRHKDDPFFIYYPMTLIHGPLGPTPDSQKACPSPAMDSAGKSGGKADESVYADNIAYQDKLVGKLVSELDQLKIREKTLIVFTGDNGCTSRRAINGKEIDGDKGSTLEGGSRVPLIISWPGTTPAGAVSRDLVDFSDFLPTFAELAGAQLPTERVIDGHSFVPQLKGQSGKPREWVYVQLSEKWYVRDARWKLYNNGQFCDMKEAPFREIEVPADTDNAEAKEARRKLQAVLDRLNPGMGRPEKSTDLKTKQKSGKKEKTHRNEKA